MADWQAFIQDSERFRAASSMIDSSERLVLACHVRPDGDAIGSMAGLGLILKDLGRDVVLYCEDPVPGPLAFLPGTASVREALDPGEIEGSGLVVLDCSERSRIGRKGQWLFDQCRPVVVLDHHISTAPVCRGGAVDGCVEYIDTSLCATGVLVFLVAQSMGWPISPEAATCLYTAVVTDTGGFRNSNTDALALAVAHELTRLGASPYKVATELYNRYPARRFRLLALVLRTLEMACGGKVAIIQATPDMFRATEATKEDTDEFVNIPRSIDGVEVAVFIKEITHGQVSVSLRSKRWADVASMAQRFGGGGHKRAAGFRVSGSASEVRAKLLALLEQELGGDEEEAA